jgi:hypothetical protein
VFNFPFSQKLLSSQHSWMPLLIISPIPWTGRSRRSIASRVAKSPLCPMS